VRSSRDDVLAMDCVSYTVEPAAARFDVDWPLDGSAALTRFQVQGSCQDGTDSLVSLDGAASRTEVSNSETGQATFLSEATVKTHVGRVRNKLGCRDRVQAVVFACPHRLRALRPRI
jgi:hypothetical protein